MATIYCPNCSKAVRIVMPGVYTQCSRCDAILRVSSDDAFGRQGHVTVDVYEPERQFRLHGPTNPVHGRHLGTFEQPWEDNLRLNEPHVFHDGLKIKEPVK